MSSNLPTYRRSTGLVDVLDRVLDKGLVVAGDIRVSLAEVELLTIRIRLLVCSVDKAAEIGLDWWRRDPHLALGGSDLAKENAALQTEVRALQEQLRALQQDVAGIEPSASEPGEEDDSARHRQGERDSTKGTEEG